MTDTFRYQTGGAQTGSPAAGNPPSGQTRPVEPPMPYPDAPVYDTDTYDRDTYDRDTYGTEHGGEPYNARTTPDTQWTQGVSVTTEQEARPSTGQLVSEIASDVSTLFRQEIALAKAELREEATKAGKGAGMLGGAGLLGLYALLFILVAVMHAFGSVMALGWAALLVGALLTAIAGTLALLGRRTVRQVHPTPTRTVETLRDDMRLAQGRR